MLADQISLIGPDIRLLQNSAEQAKDRRCRSRHLVRIIATPGGWSEGTLTKRVGPQAHKEQKDAYFSLLLRAKSIARDLHLDGLASLEVRASPQSENDAH